MVENCQHVLREISNYLDDEVSPALRATMEEHFRTCKDCTSVLEGMRNVVALYGDERMIEVPAGFGRRLEKRIAQDVRASRPGWSTWSTWSAWLVPVAAMMLVFGGLQWARSVTPTVPIKSELAQPAQSIPPDMIVLVADGTKVFHVAGCGVIHNKATVRSLTAKEAMKEGYAPCVRCLRKYVNVATLKALHGYVETASREDVEEEEEMKAEAR